MEQLNRLNDSRMLQRTCSLVSNISKSARNIGSKSKVTDCNTPNGNIDNTSAANDLLEEWPASNTLLEDWNSSKIVPIELIDREKLKDAVDDASNAGKTDKDEFDITLRRFMIKSTYTRICEIELVDDPKRVETKYNTMLEEFPASRGVKKDKSARSHTRSKSIDYQSVRQSLRELV